MDTPLTDEFQAALSQLSNLEEPKTREQVGEQLGFISVAISICEKILIYLATTEQGREDMLDYLFQYKQLINTERLFQDKRVHLPATITQQPVKRRWWQPN